MSNFINDQEMNSNLLSYPDSVNFKTGELGSTSTVLSTVLIVIVITVFACLLIMKVSKSEEENLLDIIENK